jgi:hypothetical protein
MLVLISIIESLWLQVGPLFNHVLTDGGVKRIHRRFVELADALQKGDGTAARASMEADIYDAGEVVLGILRARISGLTSENQSKRNAYLRHQFYPRVSAKSQAASGLVVEADSVEGDGFHSSGRDRYSRSSRRSVSNVRLWLLAVI